MNEVDALLEIVRELKNIKFALHALIGVFWLFLLFKDCHGSTHDVAESIKELTNHFRSRR